MAKSWFLALILFFSVCQIPVGSFQNRSFFAVFANPKWEHDLDKFNPDLIVVGKSWDSFPYFVQRIKDLAGDRPIVIDIMVHGEPEGSLYLEDAVTDGYHESNPGYVLNQLSTIPHIEKVYLEACYAGLTMETGLTKDYKFNLQGDHVEKWKGKTIDYPIYGVHRCSNYVGLVLFQDYFNKRVEFYDLRQFIGHTPEEPDDSLRRDLWALYCVLSSLNP